MNSYVAVLFISLFGITVTACSSGGGSDDPVSPPPPPPAPESKKVMVSIPATNFEMGCREREDILCLPGTTPHRVTLDSYKIDKYMVTFGRYQDCIDAGECSKPYEGAACNYGLDWTKDHPTNCITYKQAEEVCAFEGKRLPTEAEWVLAARGPDSFYFPWGNDAAPSCDLAVMNQKRDGKMGPGCGAGTTQEVGSKPQGVSPFGLHDVTGNLWEWTSDWYSESYFGNSDANNPKGPAAGTHRVLRGSSWTSRRVDELALTVRYAYAPEGQGYIIGARCAADL